MPPFFKILPQEILPKVIDEALELLRNPGIKVGSSEALELLHSSGAEVNHHDATVKIPQELVQKALITVPHEFYLHDAEGTPVVHYSGDEVHFDPGSSGVNILDSDSRVHRPSETGDLIQIIKTAEGLAEYDAQSTAVICHDVPEEIGDFYRLFLVLLFSKKPIVTGAFSTATSQIMIDLLNISAGSGESAAQKPRAIFDVCPSPPLNWTEFAAQNLIDLARNNIPAEIVSMPLSGAASPVTLIGSIVQHAAECLSGITIHQLANPGSAIVWGGAPALFNMRDGTTSVGAAETSLIVCGYAQIGKYLNLPTHAYLGASDAKLIDGQAGMESASSSILGALSGINMISGGGMLDFLACLSLEKLVIDAEAIAFVRRLLKGISIPSQSLSLEHYEDFEFPGNFLKHKLTRQLFREEQYLPSTIIDRGSLRAWKDTGSGDIVSRAKTRVQELLSNYQPIDLPSDKQEALQEIVSSYAKQAGMTKLPAIIK
ncbi:MAG: trimethylamine methyltransferase family protein [Chloroflexota bacterium]|nr:MAG: trimethylamine methyltransferase family protein [Chloroflexota bacterium]